MPLYTQNGQIIVQGGALASAPACCCSPAVACCCVNGTTLTQDSFPPGVSSAQMEVLCESCGQVYACWLGGTNPVIVASCDECVGEGDFCVAYAGSCGTYYSNCDAGTIYSLYINYVVNGSDECPTLPEYDAGTFSSLAACEAALAALIASPPAGACDISYGTSVLCSPSCIDTNNPLP